MQLPGRPWTSCLAGTAYRVSGAPSGGRQSPVARAAATTKLKKVSAKLSTSSWWEAVSPKPSARSSGLARDFFCHGKDSNPRSKGIRKREKIRAISMTCGGFGRSFHCLSQSFHFCSSATRGKGLRVVQSFHCLTSATRGKQAGWSDHRPTD